MTLRPQIIRADTLDLQDHDAPSAGDHTGQPEHPNPLGSGPPAPSQEGALRSMSQDRSAEHEHLADVWGSGRSSHEGSELLEEESSSFVETRLDEAAIQQNGGDGPETGDEDDDDTLDDDMMDDRSSSPSIGNEEDIDYDFVYALHNFVATVEGQANATKGDHMVLLDDSNSYWWLVRVVKDSSIGYLPAEHIETPVERLARYNKHKNVETTQESLEDHARQQKPPNPLKKALRRRNAKSVQFAPPKFYEPVEIDWSDEEGDNDLEEDANGTEGAQAINGQQADSQEPAAAESAQSNGQSSQSSEDTIEPVSSDANVAEASRTALEGSRPEQDSLEQPERTPGRSRNGVIRNTDSFFKDNTAEPRKISLTPNLLRDESGDGSMRSSGSSDKGTPVPDVFEQVDNGAAVAEKAKEDKKRKDKKSGMLSGLFKRKEKKIKVDEAAGGVVVKQETESGSPLLTPGDSGRESPTGADSAVASQMSQTSKRSSSGRKLSKSPPSGRIAQSNGALPDAADPSVQPLNIVKQTAASGDETPATSVPGQEAEARQLPAETASSPPSHSPVPQSRNPFSTPRETESEDTLKGDDDADLDTQPSSFEAGGANDSALTESNGTGANDSYSRAATVPSIKMSDGLKPSRSDLALDTSAEDQRSVSPPSPFDPGESLENASQEHPESSANSSTRSASKIIEPASTPTASASPASASTPTAAYSTDAPLNDGALRRYLESRSSEDAKDMIIRVHDSNGVIPLPLDHPKMLGFGFHESQKQLAEMSSQLDGMLNGFLARAAARPKTQRK